MLERRVVLRAGLAVAGGAVGLALAGCTDTASRGPEAAPRESSGSLTSAHWPGRSVPWRLVVPAAASPPPGTVVFLHGRGGSANDVFDALAGARVAAATGLALAAIDGGDTYWHRRRDGSDTGAIVLNDLLPVLADHGAPTHRIGLAGLSMGGYGALLLATRLPAARLIGVATMSAALWIRPGDSAAGAFDDAEDFARNDVFDRVATLRRLPVWLACGTADPFIAGNRALAARLPSAVTRFDRGGHDGTYWSARLPEAMSWMARRAAG